MERLLGRDEFRHLVLERSKGRCVFCGKPAVDAHHILDRALWSDGGYYLDNGAAVCSDCHMACEKTDISVQEVLYASKIFQMENWPDSIDKGPVDKWGNPLLPNGARLKGPLFYKESVQKILVDKLHLFTDYVKYPRTPHLPWSPGRNPDDLSIVDKSFLAGRQIVVTVKMDGENTTLYRDYVHARSLDSGNHPSRNWVRGFHATIANDIPQGWRVCGENLFAKHSIFYTDLPSYFLGFSVWNEQNICLSWKETSEWFELLGVTPVPVIYEGVYSPELLQSLDIGDAEGYVVRVADAFTYQDFSLCVAKYVRPNHVQTDEHWMTQPIVVNGVKK